MEFKEGDKVEVIRECCGTILGEVYTLAYGYKNVENQSTLVAWKDGKISEGGSGCSCQDNWELLKTNSLQNQYKAGLRDGNLELTEQGKKDDIV